MCSGTIEMRWCPAARPTRPTRPATRDGVQLLDEHSAGSEQQAQENSQTQVVSDSLAQISMQTRIKSSAEPATCTRCMLPALLGLSCHISWVTCGRSCRTISICTASPFLVICTSNRPRHQRHVSITATTSHRIQGYDRPKEKLCRGAPGC